MSVVSDPILRSEGLLRVGTLFDLPAMMRSEIKKQSDEKSFWLRWFVVKILRRTNDDKRAGS